LSTIQRKDSKRKITTDANPQLTWPHNANHNQSQVPDGSHHPWTSPRSAISLNEFTAKATIAMCVGYFFAAEKSKRKKENISFITKISLIKYDLQ
jgi:hypothetical protein